MSILSIPTIIEQLYNLDSLLCLVIHPVLDLAAENSEALVPFNAITVPLSQ